ncbi:MAG TPA: hypothetical protein RMH85_20975 [Polyangiaceae bacterium LLY-WYZ-15_(1-7)]|nr:hypothetical protein [Polyangiaceae bacterium LLY-WYZ-15_(1-7)]HJL10961.1 hypothetical protein [Polyangiaceae bacterium LLY-WYZ-15_(1-7)]HJL25870.1 hypothetical protein [Polyangiaceae bacterium LLY-WYZ-15_(1-7)]HJL35098.1 hypothetical protein [Polyangiaceae bacterium LLY-WYZ-15_(1-7)]HJL50288.1 hypothetical protein [Polyangiaceae bacterium LLY-WYZ-15_(1-7)]
MTEELTTDAVEIAPDTYWVGRRDPGGIFFANPYLRVFRGGEGKAEQMNMLIDPGASSDFAVVQAKCASVMGSIRKTHAVFINHQDPDVGSVVGPLMARFAPHARLLCSEDTWRLVRFFNVPKDRYVCVDPYVKDGLRLPTGHQLAPVPSPYCHFAGAVMLYDPETRVLFTGDLFGGLTAKDARGLWADESDWPGMRAFHQLYMPANAALKHAVAAIRALDPAPEILAPQHGRLARGAMVEEFLSRIERLPVGVDLLADRNASPDELRAWSHVLNRVIATARTYLGATAETRLVDDEDLAPLLEPTNEGLRVVRLGKWAVERAVHLLTDAEVPAVANAVRYEAIFAASELDLPSPNIELADEGETAQMAAQLGSLGSPAE